MGQVEFLTEASFASNDKSYLEEANNYLTHCVENSHKSAYQFGGAGDIGLHLNLYRGIAGVGYTLLRKLDSTLPNILIWE
jgi:lantibiotic modifying enzyme